MPTTTTVLLHSNGPALWPEHKGLGEILLLQATTPEHIWQATWQLNPVPPSGTIFKRQWWDRANRFDADHMGHYHQAVARFQSYDTSYGETDTSAYTACITADLWPDYRLAIRDVWRERLDTPDQIDRLQHHAVAHNRDGKLRAVVIEAKATGVSIMQTIRKQAAATANGAGVQKWLARIIKPYTPRVDKPTRARLASTWCSNGSVLLPLPGPAVPWLVDFEDELFTAPTSAFMDQVDAFSQLVLYCENLLAAGFKARMAGGTIDK